MGGLLKQRWLAALQSVGGAAQQAMKAWPDLIARYAEPQRRYHGVDHITAVVAAVDELGGSPECVLAAFFHDAVYDPASVGNEQASAELAREVLTAAGVGAAVVSEVERLVMLTIAHRPMESDVAGAVLCDADLSTLGATPDEYDAYAAQVRAEYAHFDDATFRAGRATVLEQFLARDPIFHTSAGRRRWEDRARANLERELRAVSER